MAAEASNQVVGRATISLGAAGTLPTEHGATLDPGGTKRTPKPSDDGHIYYTSETAAPELNCKALATANINSVLLNFAGATVTFTADTGQVYIIMNAFTTDPAPLDAGNGTYDIKISGDPAQSM